ncbi:molecular chaperone DnaJ [Spiribacter vilamensis]|uniref:J domain-containing protein n=1 Tax=Spiribacter vilamensis TaxID=531306 RepID=A0A4Q8D2C3_9GAMM|nr:molecular chaperone DnaJ [Spiribacter vilamensis]RZU99447.1 hypothetical protein EV698_1738 [Spiribacter vilamensis]TVO61581.1 molecular chaperone DnaJ [Spiribacter vilamensis]
MMRLFSLLLIILALAFLLSPRFRQWLRARAPIFILGAIAVVAIVLAISGRLNWIFAAISAALPVIWRLAPLLRFLPLVARLTGRRRGKQGDETDTDGQRPASRNGRMTREEAGELLGVEADADREEVLAAHRRLMQRLHPDRGGTDYLAARLNEARDVLLGGRR